MTRQDLLRKIQVVSFILDDLKLYLDTHPTDRQALSNYADHSYTRNGLITQYTYAYGPLTLDCMYFNADWTWSHDPWPWEKEA